MTDHLSETEIQKIVTEAASKSTEEILKQLGIDTKNPQETQRDMLYLRNQRGISDRIGLATRMLLLSAFVTGICSLVWQGLTKAFTS